MANQRGAGNRPSLQFIPETHEYRLNGRWVPGATRVLSDQGYSPGSKFFTAESRQRGKAAHYACQLADQHCPEASTVDEALEILDLDERLIPYLAGFLLFKRETGFISVLREVVVASMELNVMGQFDNWGHFPDGSPALIDYKSWQLQGAKPKRSAELQLALYQIMTHETLGLDVAHRIVLKLPGDSSYRRYNCTNPTDEMVARCNAIAWWDRANAGLLDLKDKLSDVELAA